MIYVVVILALGYPLTALAVGVAVGKLLKHAREREEAVAQERSDLLTRIQVPERARALIAHPPVQPRKPVDPLEPDDADFALVGVILPEDGGSS